MGWRDRLILDTRRWQGKGRRRICLFVWSWRTIIFCARRLALPFARFVLWLLVRTFFARRRINGSVTRGRARLIPIRRQIRRTFRGVLFRGRVALLQRCALLLRRYLL